MSTSVRTDDGWVIEESATADIEELMTWFPEADDINIWGGPSFRYPFTRETFFEDIYWGRMPSFSLRDPAGDFAAFGQIYERDKRIHFARLVANPAMRRRGVGKRLISMLMVAGRTLYSRDECSLFVFRENIPAYECYTSMGFVVGAYPEDMPHADVCYYLTRPVEKEQQKEGARHEQ